MSRKYTNPQAHGYLMEAKACEKVIKELRRLADKLQRSIDKEKTARQVEFETVTGYTSEQQIQDDYGWGLFSEVQYERYMDLFRHGKEALENLEPTQTELALHIVSHIIGDIEEDCHEWKFSALSPKEQAVERERTEKSNQEWKKRIAEIRERRGMISAAPEPREDTI